MPHRRVRDQGNWRAFTMRTGMMKSVAWAAGIGLALTVGLSGLSSLAQTGSPADPLPFTETTDLRPGFRDVIFDFEGGAFDGQIGYVFAIRNLADASIALDTLPGSFVIPGGGGTPIAPSAILSAGTFYRAGLEVWDDGPEIFEPLFDEGSEVLNASPGGDRPETFIVVVPADTASLRYDLQDRRALGDRDALTTIIKPMDLTPQSPLTANAGLDRSVAVGITTSLDAGGSTNLAAAPLTYSWTVLSAPDGSTAALSDSAAVRPTFSADLDGNYVIEVSVSDGTETSTAQVVVSTNDVAPVAVLGEDQQVEAGQGRFVDISDSFDLDGTRLRNPDVFIVSKPLNSNTEYDPESQSFRPDVPGQYVVGLTVESGANGNSLVTSNIGTATFNTGNVAPRADAGDDLPGTVGEVTRLDATRSRDANGDRLSFSWTLLSQPAGSVTSLTDATSARPNLSIDAEGDYIAQLIATDEAGAQSADTIIISTINTRPVARVGNDRALTLGGVLQLDGSTSSDADDDPLTYFWTVSRRNNQTTLNDRTLVDPVYTSSNGGRKVLQLVVSDGVLDSAPARFYAPVDDSQIDPTAIVAISGDAFTGAELSLNGSASLDLNQNGLTFSWSLIHAPAGSATEIIDQSSAEAAFTPDIEGIYIAQLIVRDTLRPRFVSRPATVSVEVGEPPVVDVPPSFTSSPVLVGQVGELYTYTAAANDPEGTSIVFSLDTFPAGMEIDAATGEVTWPADLEGAVPVTIKATDAGGAFATQSFEIQVTPADIPNEAPVLAAIGNQSAPLGQTLTVQLTATDANADLLSFMANPLPLPDGALLDGETGVFTFTPIFAQANTSFDLTFSVSDGVLSDAETITVTIGDAGDPGSTALSGRVLDAVSFAANGAEVPVVGAVVQILGSGTPVVTDANGSFLLTGISGGRQLIDIVSSGAAPAPDGTVYTNFREGIELTEDVTNTIERPFFMSRITPDSIVTVDPSQMTVLDSVSTGIRIEIPPASVMNEDGTMFTGQLSVAMVPEGLTPAPLPDDLQAGVVFSVQPAGLTLTEPAEITIPNFFDLEPGDQIQLFALDPVFVEAILEVSPDGQSMFSVQGGLTTTTWKAPFGPENDDDDEGDPENKDNDMCNCADTGSTTSLSGGALRIAHNLASYTSLSQPRSITLAYDSVSAAPRPIIRRNVSTTIFRPEFQLITSSLTVEGILLPGTQTVDVSAVPARFPVTHSFTQSFDARDFPTGRYDYTLNVGSQLSTSAFGTGNSTLRITPYPGEVLINNGSNSSFGAGWGISDLTRLFEEDDDLVATRGDGSISVFEPIPNSIIPRLEPDSRLITVPSVSPASASLSQMLNTRDANRLQDIDNDNNLDLLFQRESDGLAFAMQNRTTGEFDIVRSAQTFVAGVEMSAASEFDFADFNEDGVEDLVVGNVALGLSDFGGLFPVSDNGNISINLGQGGGFFTQPTLRAPAGCDPDFETCIPELVSDVAVRFALPDGRSPVIVKVADIDNDGHQDIVAASDEMMNIYFGDGTGNFPDIVSFPCVLPPANELGEAPTIVITDFNEDGFLEIAIDAEEFSTAEAMILNNQTGRTFQQLTVPALESAGAATGELLGVTDFTNDGQLDLLFLVDSSGGFSFRPDELIVLPGNGDLTFGSPITSDTDASEDAFLFDVSGNRVPDLVYLQNFDEVVFQASNGDGRLLDPVQLTTDASNEDVPFFIGDTTPLIGDINNDGVLDILELTTPDGGLRQPLAESADPIVEITADGEFIIETFNGFGTPRILLANGDERLPEETITPFIDPDTDGEVTFGDRVTIGPDGQITYDDFANFILSATPVGAEFMGGFAQGTPTVFPNGDLEIVTFRFEFLETVPFTAAEAGTTVGASGEIIFPTGLIVFPDAQIFVPERIIPASENGITIDPDGSLRMPAGFLGDILIRPNGDQEFEDGSVILLGGEVDTSGFVIPPIRYRVTEVNADPSQAEAFISPGGDFSQIIRLNDGSFERTFRAGEMIRYDSNGLQTAKIDRNGNTTVFNYDGNSQLVSITDPVGLVTRLDYQNGLLTAIIDPGNRVTSFEHDEDGRLIRITDPDGSSRQFDYTPTSLMASQTSKRGFVTEYQYDSFGRNLGAILPDGTQRQIIPSDTFGLEPITASGVDTTVDFATPTNRRSLVTNGRGAVEITTTDQFGSILSRVDALGRTTFFTRDNDGQISGTISPAGRITTITRDQFGSAIRVDNSSTASFSPALQRSTKFTFDNTTGLLTSASEPFDSENDAIVSTFTRDGSGNIVTTIDGLENSVIRTFDSRGLLTTETDENGNTTSFSYDTVGNLIAMVNPLGIESRFQRDTAGNMTSLTDAFGTPNQRVTSFTHDNLNRVLSSTDGDGSTTLFNYDLSGNLLETVDSTGFVQGQEYDSRDRLVAVLDPRKGRTEITLDAEGNAVQITDASGNSTILEYDLADQLVSSTNPLGQATLFQYDLDGNLATVTNGRGAITRFAYDAFGRTISRVNPVGGTTSYEYDSRDNIVSVTDAKGQTIEHSHDALDRLVSMTTPDNELRFSYDNNDNLLTANDNDTSLTYSYNEIDSLVSVASTGTMIPEITIDLSYNERGLRTELVDSLGGGQTYLYDLADRLQALTTNLGSSIQVQYDSAGRPLEIRLGAAVISSVSYESGMGRIEALSNISGATNLYTANYQYNSVGNITEIAEAGQIGDKTRQFTYDELRRLVAGGTDEAPESYSYDEVGNRETTHLSAIHITNGADRLVQDEQFIYEYDANGNLITQTEISTDLVTNYIWDAQDQLVGISNGDGSTVAYAYDALGRRTAKILGATTELYAYDGEDIYLELSEDNVVLARYAHGDRVDNPLSFERSGTEYFYLTDHQGSIRQVVDSSGLVVNQYSYDSYGNFLERVESVAQIYGYTAREQDPESALLYYRSRFYDPRIGRFIQQDRIGFDGNDFNIYRYLQNNPLNDIDPEGELGLLGAGLGFGLDLALQLAERFACGQDLGEALGNLDVGSLVLATGAGALGGVGGGAAARRLASRASNRAKGKIGEAFTRARLARRGQRVTGRGQRASDVFGPNRLNGRGRNSRPDFTVRNRDGSSSFVESKFNTSGLTPAQRDAARQLGDDFRVDRTTLEDVRRAGGAAGAGVGAGSTAGASPDECECP